MDAERYDIARPLDLQLAVLRSQRSVLLRGASDLDRSVVATIVSELGSNVLKYAVRGSLELRRLRGSEAPGVEITAQDAGPGIPDVALALTDRYSSGRTLGLGLPGVQRMADELEITPTPGGGTTVRVRKRWARAGSGADPGPEAPSDANLRSVARGVGWRGAATVRPRDGRRGGDAALLVPREDLGLLAIVDATGHGPEAHALAWRLIDRLRTRFLTTPAPNDAAVLLHDLHEACVGTVGAAAGLALLDAASDQLRYLAVGNVRAAVLGPERFTGVSRDGMLGRRWPTPFVQSARLRPGDLMLLWTDGLPASLARDLAGDASTGAGVTSAALADHAVAAYGRGYDDAACVVARWRP